MRPYWGGLSFRFARGDISPVARGCSAVGSASPCQGEGRGFESRHPLEGAVASTPAVEWPSGEATACKAVHTGSIPVSTSHHCAISSAGERFPDTEEVTGSIPVSRTSIIAGQSLYLDSLYKSRLRYQDDWAGCRPQESPQCPTPFPTTPPTPSPQRLVFHVASPGLALQPRASAVRRITRPAVSPPGCCRRR